MRFEVEFYVDDRGDVPMRDFLESLRTSQPILYRLATDDLLKLADSHFHGPPLTQQVDSSHGIYELRVGRADIARVFFFFRMGRKIIVTNGYVKKRQKLDRREIERARRLKFDWEERQS
ncbi:MAG: type II toxin-antitoxin system RelE/ParE family toxin [Chloroflexia bacterium]|nr:type II toxin-antitoxin system RelE/ParE family toxin [Chloroflexia bacterium]